MLATIREELRQDIHVACAAGKDNRRAPFSERFADIGCYELVTRLVCDEGIRKAREGEGGFRKMAISRKTRHKDAGDGRLLRQLFAGLITNRTTLHEDDGLVSIFADRCGGETIHITRRDETQDILKSESRDMMTLVHDNHSV